MSFEAFPAEVVQQFNNPGPYYVRENGKLRSPPGMGSCARSLCKPGQTTNLVIQANSTDGLENSPRKLFDITLDFVTLNIGLVDSLVGFPEVVGRQLFEASHRHGNLGLQALRLFSDAYGDAILQSINLSGHHLAVNQHSNCLAVFQYLSELEVGGCSLGDDHEILPTIANCHSLKRLGLANNRLTDVGMQRLTSPLRVMGKGPRNLRILDLSGNNLIGDKSAKLYLTAFSSLQAIDLSGCSVTSRGLDMLKSKLRLEIGASSDASPFHLPVKTIGWAFPLVAEWIVSSTALMQRAKTKASKDHAPGASKAINFNGRALKRLENVSGSSLSETTRPVFPIVRLVAATALGSQPTSDPVENEVSMSEVSNAVERRSKKCVPRQQTGEDNHHQRMLIRT
ncbi:leucine-rich repeat-containing protein 42-like [Acanthaster planci]|uniref:Leucine-rich repeat-containing protein 42 n=1 Tax=Acanthaster planci TaxID=133434 RepID=A0A8B7YBW4_ACAPL|nr:leucine-rich repeat-containing protein 42-like [Acanthaster planci]XP_022089179.1 leucine-rich repeat-containing protein 42-like [Acanthaster planci]XP_022089181.1 leucine-rich repeat-containing protein 42-like [Acanthaster planci]